jgi:hypothetical protein
MILPMSKCHAALSKYHTAFQVMSLLSSLVPEQGHHGTGLPLNGDGTISWLNK